MNHVINKLSFELACSEEQQAFDMRDRFQKTFYDEFVSVIEDSCTQFSNQDQILRLDKLEINLNVRNNLFFDKQHVVTEFREAFLQELKTKLSSIAVRQTVPQSRLATLKWFLTHGTLPWWANEKDINLENWCKELQLSHEGQNDFIGWLHNHQDNTVVWLRIAFQLQPSFKAFVVGAFPELNAAALSLKHQLEQLIHQNDALQFLQNKYPDEINAFVLRDAANIVGSAPRISATSLFQMFLAGLFSQNDLKNLPATLLDNIAKGREALKEYNAGREQEKYLNNQLNDLLEELMANDDESKGIKLKTEKAGIILIAAFLPTFFKKLGIWKENDWADEPARLKAILLLHYLATERDAAFEYELLFEKIICGVSLNTAISSSSLLSEKEKKEADLLLESVIEHWSALKNTSVSGLRQAFLQREGLLFMKQDNWFLEVEKTTRDILIEQLPWGYATIMLPWNKYLICTEW